jgi:type VI secretion system secreted protein Hcp
MAVDIFLKLDPIKGESNGKDHVGEIDIISWGWGLDQTGTFHQGSGGGAGKVNVHDLSFTHHVDTATTDLMIACASGKHFAKGILTVRKAGDKPLEFLKITIEEVFVTSVSTGGASEDDYAEHVTLNFAKVKVEYKQQTDKGAAGATSEMNWNVPANAER